MYISKFHIRNFKCFQDVTLYFNPEMNVLTGVNNAGKTTLLEALALWHECFMKLLMKAQRNERKSKTRRGDFRLGNSQHYYLSYQELRSVRSPSFEDIFYKGDAKEKLMLTATLEEPGQSSLEIPFTISGGRRNTYEIDCKLMVFDHFNAFFRAFPEPVQAVFSSPVAGILQVEEFCTRPKIKNQVIERLAAQVMRNRLHQLSLDLDRFEELKIKLAGILSDGVEPIQFGLRGRITEDMICKVLIDFGNGSSPQDLSLVGSGTLQIIELLLSIIETRSDLNLVLLDEPDSHLHRRIQDRLYRTLLEFNQGARADSGQHLQIFLTTHNESLIRAANPEFVFHLDGAVEGEYRNLLQHTPRGVKRGLQPSGKEPILKSLGSESALELITALESDQLFLVEGESDAYFLQALAKGIRFNLRKKFMFWSYDGIDTILKNLKVYKQIFESIKNEKNLWEKSVLVLDRDYLTDDQTKFLSHKIEARYGIPVVMWQSSMTESSFLSDVPKLSLALTHLLRKRQGLNQNSEIVRTAIETSLNQAIQAKIGYYRQLVTERSSDAEAFEIKVKNYFRKTQQFVQDLGLSDNQSPFKSKSDFVTRYGEYCKEVVAYLNRNLLHAVATKTDVAEILNEVLAAQGSSFEVADFPELFDTIQNNTKMDLWDPFLDFM